MIVKLTPSAKQVYNLLSLTVILLLLTMTCQLLGDLQRLAIPSIFRDFPVRFDELSTRLSDGLVLTGFVTGGVMMCLERIHAKHFRRVIWLWMGCLVIGVMVSSGVLAVGLLGFLALTYNRQNRSRYLAVWQAGIALIILLLPLVAITDNTTLSLCLTHVAYGMTGVSITFWLMSCWSKVRAQWLHDGIGSVAGAVGVAGTLISLSQLPLPAVVGGVAGVIIAPCYAILGGHHYRALRDRTHDMSLSPHWIAMATVFWLSVGAIGILSSQAGIRDMMRDTYLEIAQHDLIQWTLVMVVLALVNYTAAYLRGENRRVTGYIPLWLIGFGVAFSTIATLCAGVLDIYLSEFVGIEQAFVGGLLLPVVSLRIICLTGVAVGVVIYALGFVARRPKIVMD